MKILNCKNATKDPVFTDALKPLSGLLTIFGVDILVPNDATGKLSPRTVIKWLLRIAILVIIGMQIGSNYQKLLDPKEKEPTLKKLTPLTNIALADLLFACVCCVTLWANEKRLRNILGPMTNKAFPRLEEHRSSYRRMKLFTITVIIFAVLIVLLATYPMVASKGIQRLALAIAANPSRIITSLLFWLPLFLSSLFCVLMAVACAILLLQLHELSSATTTSVVQNPKDLEKRYRHTHAMVINVNQVFSSALPFLYMIRCYTFVVMVDWLNDPMFQSSTLLILALHLFQFSWLTIPPIMFNNMLKSPMDVPQVHHVQPAFDGAYNYNPRHYEEAEPANPSAAPRLTAGGVEISTETWVKVIVCCAILIWLNYTLSKFYDEFKTLAKARSESAAVTNETATGNTTKKRTVNWNKSKGSL